MEYTQNMGLNYQTLEAYPVVKEISGVFDELYLRDLSCKGKQSPKARKIKVIRMEEMFRRDIEKNPELPLALIANVQKRLSSARDYCKSKTLS